MRLDQLLSELGSHERPRIGPWFRCPRPRRPDVAQPSTRGNRCTEPDGGARQILQLPRAKRMGWGTPSGGFGLYTPPCSTGSTPTNTFCAAPPAHRCDTRSGRNCQPVNSRSCDSSRPQRRPRRQSHLLRDVLRCGPVGATGFLSSTGCEGARRAPSCIARPPPPCG